MDEDPDRELFIAWRDGDRSAGKQLFSRHFDHLLLFFKGKVSEDAEDLMHNTWLKCQESAANFRQDSTFRAFLFGIAWNVFKDHIRRRARAQKRIQEVEDIEQLPLEQLCSSPLDLLSEQEEVRLFARALRRVPLKAQALFELAYWQKLPGPAISEVLGIPEGTVRSRLRRARKLVETEMAKIASSPEELARTISGFETWSARVRELSMKK